MSILEEKIRKNKGYFDVHEPSKKHINKFKSKLSFLHPEKKKKQNYFSTVLKIAASLIIIAVISILVTEIDTKNNSFAANAVKTDNLSEDLKELQEYYNSVTTNKIKQIEGISCNTEECAELKTKTINEINQLNENNKQLQDEFSRSNESNKVMNAIVNNYQLMTKILDKMINKSNELNK